MKMLPFKNTDGAMEYIQEYFSIEKLQKNKTYYGRVKDIDKAGSPPVYVIEVIVLEKRLLSETRKRLVVAGIKHEELPSTINRDDLVVWGCLEDKITVPAGVIIHKLKPILNIESGRFELDETEETKP